MFSGFNQRQGGEKRLPIIYVSNRSDPRVQEIIDEIAKKKNKPPNKVNDQEIIKYLKEQGRAFVAEEEEATSFYERFLKWFGKS